MAAVDIFILLVIGISCLIGVFRGLIKEALSLVFWIGAIIAAGLFSTAAGAWLSDFIASPMLQRVTAFVLIFVLVVFVVKNSDSVAVCNCYYFALKRCRFYIGAD